jgi:hypothetical protein
MAKKKKTTDTPKVGDSIVVDEDTTMEVHKVTSGTLTRYQIRNTLFRMRDNRVEEKHKELAEIVWAIIQPQLVQPENLRNFTFIWDVDPHNPVKLIRRSEWEKRKEEMYPDQYKKQEQVEEEITMFTAQG